jgi:hypothetical protein
VKIFSATEATIDQGPCFRYYKPRKRLLGLHIFLQGGSGFLIQEGQVVCYESKKLNEHEQNYATHDLELSAIVHALKMWRHYLLGRRFILMTDHFGMKYFFNHPRLNASKSKWKVLIAEFDFEIKNIKGKENKVVDALS